MDLAVNTWYPAARLFRAGAIELRDGSTLMGSADHFHGSLFTALSGTLRSRRRDDDALPPIPDRYFHVTLHEVDQALVDDLPPAAGISPKLLREQLLYLRESTFAYDLVLRREDDLLVSPGAVCVRLLLTADAPSADVERRSQGVADAWRSGLIDDWTRSRADFRLDLKPLTRRLVALVESDYLPDDAYRIDVLFAAWSTLHDGHPKRSPLRGDVGAIPALEDCELQFRRTTRQRGMRVSDLFERK